MDATAPGQPKEEPRASASWSAKGVDYTLTPGVALGDRVRVVLEGHVRGQSMQEYGCSIDLIPESVTVEAVAGATAAAVKKLQKRMKGEEY